MVRSARPGFAARTARRVSVAVDEQDYFNSKKIVYKRILRIIFWVALAHIVVLSIMAMTLV